ncbi:hypothetical protein EDD80_1053 [Anseongella ginsenosidimutans]|uniref:Nucleic acid-binding protein n=1 Tax=Anseongella ginsenosidimutans TaxID=496056 RepID=A0A4R3KQJ7_9SPHI|nr:hypothetical protein [Anseongella ginsenosidimutans]TCS87192.1 hypothetical protein EDD80_1053 [Anseongella ginsenosidimutans]
MKLTITDACIFIDLHLLGLVVPFFELDVETHTSLDVFNELNEEQQHLLSAYQSMGKLTVHTIHHEDRIAIHKVGYPKALSEMDCTVLYLAVQLGAIVLSSDKTVRNFAKKSSIEYHGMLWILDELVVQNRIASTVAASKLRQLITSNYIYQNNAVLVKEMNKRLRIWQ